MLDRSSIVNQDVKIRNISGLRALTYNDLAEQWEYRPKYRGGTPMTVCIAAICDQGRAIVVCADKMIGSAFIQVDTNVSKIVLLDPKTKHLTALIAGNDIGPVPDVIVRAQQKIAEMGSGPSQNQARVIVAEAFAEIRLRKAEERFLVARNLSMAKFTAEGRSLLGDQLFTQIDRQIFQSQLDFELLVTGFDDDGPFIFTVSDPGVVVPFIVPGFHATGSGDLNALSSLHQRKLDPFTTLGEALYAVYEAKKYAELVGGVGRTSDIFVLRRGKNFKAPDDVLKVLDEIWEHHKPVELTAEEKKNLGEVVAKVK